jgi:type I restriction enzyme S subunit
MSNTQDNLSSEKFGSLPILLPPKNTQRQICKKLDTNLEPINSLISSSKDLLELIEQRKRSLTEELISGCSAADDVKLKYVTNMLPGYAFSSDRFSNSSEGIPLLRGINVDVGETSWEDTVYWTSDLDEYSDYLLEPDDIVLAMDRPWVNDGMRIAQLEEDDCPALLVQRVLRIRTTEEVLQEYVRIALESVRFKQYFDPLLTGVSVPHISKEQVGDFSIPLPSIEVQRSIVAEWENFHSTKKKLELVIKSLVDILEEKRQALITAAVTGQIDVSEEKGVIQDDD